MLIVGIIGQQSKVQTANLISLILNSTGKKVSIIDSKSFIGLNSCLIKSYLNELKKNNTDILILKIAAANIKKELFYNIHFDIIIYTEKADDLREEEMQAHEEALRWVFSIMDEKGVLIINLDEQDIVKILKGLDKHVVTYGFNSKASVTTSSVGDTVFEDTFICCLQKTIPANNGLLIEPQEYRVNIKPNGYDRHSILAAASFAIVNGIDLNNIYCTGEEI